MKKISLVAAALLWCSLVFGVAADPDVINWRGCSNGDGEVNISDVLYTTAYLYEGGPAPVCMDAADANNDGALNHSDIVFTLNYLFNGGPAPDNDPLPYCP